MAYQYDFVTITCSRQSKNSPVVVRPDFLMNHDSRDLFVIDGKFYAVWDPIKKLWSKKKVSLYNNIDAMTAEKYESIAEPNKKMLKMTLFNDGIAERFDKYCKTLDTNMKQLDTKIIFNNTETRLTDYATMKLPYDLVPMPTPNYDRLMSVLYSPSERHKLEYAIGSIIDGRSKTTQKFYVLYGSPGTGKSTVLGIINKLFKGYTKNVRLNRLVSGSTFAGDEVFDNPLVIIDDDCKLDNIIDNSFLNKLTSHETIMVERKRMEPQPMKPIGTIFAATNSLISITDSKAGIIRRLVDIYPTGNMLNKNEYDIVTRGIDMELGGIAYRCLRVFQESPGYYDLYMPAEMYIKSNPMFDFVRSNSERFVNSEFVTAKDAFTLYKQYMTDFGYKKQSNYAQFKEDFSSYWNDYNDRFRKNGKDIRSVYMNFKESSLLENDQYRNYDNFMKDHYTKKDMKNIGELKQQSSILTRLLANHPAQYGNSHGKPTTAWSEVKTTLADIDPTQTHYVLMELRHIVLDFDKKDETGKKSLELNLEALKRVQQELNLPATYVETSNSGFGLHAHYIYDGDPNELASLIEPDVEIKVFKGKSALRRKEGLCNSLPVASIEEGVLPLKEVKSMVSTARLRDAKELRNKIRQALKKETNLASTKSNIDWINELLNRAYESGFPYDVTDMREEIRDFAAHSTHQADYCLQVVANMKFISENNTFVDSSLPSKESDPIVFYDIECYPNYFLICYEYLDKDKVFEMHNPSPSEVCEFMNNFRLVGYNNTEYDNHMLWFASTLTEHDDYNKALFARSSSLIHSSRKERWKYKFKEATSLAYLDVMQMMNTKESLKWWEVELGITHIEMEIPFDKPIPKELVPRMTEYCKNDVHATKLLFLSKLGQAAYSARLIMSAISGLEEYRSTNDHSAAIIFGEDPWKLATRVNGQTYYPHQSQFNNPDLSKEFPGYEFNVKGIPDDRYNEEARNKKRAPKKKPSEDDELEVFDEDEKPISSHKSLYMGYDPSEGGFAKGYPGVYEMAAVMDIESMHPHSVKALNLFGDEYTRRYYMLVEIRLNIKHGKLDIAREMIHSLLPRNIAREKEKMIMDYVSDQSLAGALSDALKVVINSVYGLTSISYPGPFKHPDNIDNKVAKRGALFMIHLKFLIEEKGFTAFHFKTDSVKIANATPEIIEFVKEEGRKFGYNFEHEATYEKICLLDDAQFIAKYASKEECEKRYGYIPTKQKPGKWTATGKKFMRPFIFKTLFSHEPLEPLDYATRFQVRGGAKLYLFNGIVDFNYLKDPAHQKDERLIYQGSVGNFIPVLPGNGGELIRQDSKSISTPYSYAPGSKYPWKVGKGEKQAYDWMNFNNWKDTEEDIVNVIDRRYFDYELNDAINKIEQFGVKFSDFAK